MSQSAATPHSQAPLKGRHNDSSEDKLTYLLGFLMGGLVSKGYCLLDKEDLKRLIGAKRMSREVWETVYQFIPEKINKADVVIQDQGSSVMLSDRSRFTTFSERLLSGEA